MLFVLKQARIKLFINTISLHSDYFISFFKNLKQHYYFFARLDGYNQNEFSASTHLFISDNSN